MHVILATQEAEIRQIAVQSQPGANSSRDPISKINTKQDCQISSSTSMSSNSSTAKKKKKKKKTKKRIIVQYLLCLSQGRGEDSDKLEIPILALRASVMSPGHLHGAHWVQRCQQHWVLSLRKAPSPVGGS
jgi:hypothetical protein